jgi:hypothetical protein
MKEYAGICSVCGRDIHCQDGFLNGIVNENKTMCCFDCHEELNKKPDKSDSNFP